MPIKWKEFSLTNNNIHALGNNLYSNIQIDSLIISVINSEANTAKKRFECNVTAKLNYKKEDTFQYKNGVIAVERAKHRLN